MRIKTNTQDSEDSLLSGNEEVAKHQMTYTNRSISLIAAYFVELTALLFIVVLPLSVHAGVFSSLLGTADESTVVAVPIVQNTPVEVRLLSARVTANPHAAQGGGDVIVDEGALVSSGPFGKDEYESQTLSGEISVYVVREDDSLSQIAEMFGVTTNTILWANDIAKASTIQPGDTLIILPIVGVRHVVKSGDTLGSIAKKYEGDLDEILAYNQLASEASLRIGDTLVIPGGNMHRAAPKRIAKSSSVAPTKTTGVSTSVGLLHPVPGAVRTQGLHGYNAVDLAIAAGTPIRSAAAGEVIVAKSSGWNGGYGIYIVVKHANGSQTLYAHNSSNTVGVGAYVSQGEVIGYVGSTGKSTGDHVHFEVRGASNPF